jgi:starch synthase
LTDFYYGYNKLLIEKTGLKKIMKIAFASSEVFPFAKAGGLADVAGALPKELSALGHEVKVFMPKYNFIDEDKYGLKYSWDIGEIPVRVNGVLRFVHLHQAKLPDSNVEINFIDCPHYFFRGQIYTNDHDEDERFILFSKGIIEVLQRLKWAPDVFHCNDWQTGLLPMFVKDNYSWDRMFANTSFVFTIHNMGYQGIFSSKTLFAAEISAGLFYPGGPVETSGNINFMKAGILFSEIINTVSPTYAREILTPEYGAGLENILKSRQDDLSGILNGVDYETWDPFNDKLIPFHYNKDYLSGKTKNKKFLLNRFNFHFDEDIPLLGIISRLVSQKGFDLVMEVINQLMNLEAQWVILGSGEDKYEQMFNSISNRFPDKAAVYIGYNNEISHLVEAAADIFLMPSLYEPCGLNQIYSLRYGTVPVVRKTGGLNDTVLDWHENKFAGEENGTGFTFDDYSGEALYSTIIRAIDTYHNKPVWKRIQRNGMEKLYSWQNAARSYIDLYHKAKLKRAGSS